MTTPGYAANKRWRHKHPNTRYEGKARYYNRSRQEASHAYEPWTYDNEQLLLEDDRPSDRELAQLLGRSQSAILMKRMRLRRERAHS